MKLELKHLAPYLPYELLFNYTKSNGKEFKNMPLNDLEKGKYTRLKGNSYEPIHIKDITPLLRPLSDLTKEIEHDGEKFYPMRKINKLLPDETELDIELDLEVYTEEYCTSRYLNVFEIREALEKLFEWHFDVFGLIDQGLAIKK